MNYNSTNRPLQTSISLKDGTDATACMVFASKRVARVLGSEDLPDRLAGAGLGNG